MKLCVIRGIEATKAWISQALFRLVCHEESRVGRNKITQAKLWVSVSGKVGRVVPETPIFHFRSNSLIPAYRTARPYRVAFSDQRGRGWEARYRPHASILETRSFRLKLTRTNDSCFSLTLPYFANLRMRYQCVKPMTSAFLTRGS